MRRSQRLEQRDFQKELRDQDEDIQIEGSHRRDDVSLSPGRREVQPGMRANRNYQHNQRNNADYVRSSCAPSSTCATSRTRRQAWSTRRGSFRMAVSPSPLVSPRAAMRHSHSTASPTEPSSRSLRSTAASTLRPATSCSRPWCNCDHDATARGPGDAL